MPKHLPPVAPKGTRFPGAGRVKGKPNAISVEVRELVAQLVTDPRYQLKLRQDFQQRRVHPTMESLIWTYHLGRPRQDVHLTGVVDVNTRLEEERHLFAQLDVRVLERLAAKSQALVDEAIAEAEGTVTVASPQDVVLERNTPEQPTELLGISSGSDNTDYGCYEKRDREGGTDDGGEE